MEPEGSLPCSQRPAACLYHQPEEMILAKNWTYNPKAMRRQGNEDNLNDLKQSERTNLYFFFAWMKFKF
jgi:hypothetical protein